jgi:hypothetical protein
LVGVVEAQRRMGGQRVDVMSGGESLIFVQD